MAIVAAGAPPQRGQRETAHCASSQRGHLFPHLSCLRPIRDRTKALCLLLGTGCTAWSLQVPKQAAQARANETSGRWKAEQESGSFQIIIVRGAIEKWEGEDGAAVEAVFGR